MFTFVDVLWTEVQNYGIGMFGLDQDFEELFAQMCQLFDCWYLLDEAGVGEDVTEEQVRVCFLLYFEFVGREEFDVGGQMCGMILMSKMNNETCEFL